MEERYRNSESFVKMDRNLGWLCREERTGLPAAMPIKA